jgi:hypothetical protein
LSVPILERITSDFLFARHPQKSTSFCLAHVTAMQSAVEPRS